MGNDNTYSITTNMEIVDESPKSQYDRDNANIVDEQIGPYLHGPALPKIKSMWTWIIRHMDTPLLGKRGNSTEAQVSLLDEEEEAQRVKREK